MEERERGREERWAEAAFLCAWRWGFIVCDFFQNWSLKCSHTNFPVCDASQVWRIGLLGAS